MTPQPSPETVFRRAIASGSVTLPLGATAELGRPLDLKEAAGGHAPLRSPERPRYGRTAAKFAGRFVVERGPVELSEAQLLFALLAALPDQPTAAARGLEAFLDGHGERGVAEVVRRFEVERPR